MLCISVHVTVQPKSALRLFAVRVFKVIPFSLRDLLALSTVAHNWVICITSLLKMYFVWLFFGQVMQFKTKFLSGSAFGTKRQVSGRFAWQ